MGGMGTNWSLSGGCEASDYTHRMAVTDASLALEFRCAREEDLEMLRALQRRSLRALGRPFYPPALLEAAVEYVARPDLQLVRDGTYFVVEEEGAPIACGGWSYRKRPFAGPRASEQDVALLDPNTEAARIRAMFVEPDHAGRGVGARLLSHCEQAAFARGFGLGELGATLSGERFYLRHGWVEIERVHHPLENGMPIEVVRMQKSFG